MHAETLVHKLCIAYKLYNIRLKKQEQNQMTSKSFIGTANDSNRKHVFVKNENGLL